MNRTPKGSAEEESVVRLSRKDAEFILHLLEHPPKPNQRLRGALQAFRKTVREKEVPDFAGNLKNVPLVGQRIIQEIAGDSDLLMRHLDLSSRLRKALELAGAIDLPIPEFCRRFPYPVLRRHRDFKRNIVAEIVALLYRNAVVAQWLRAVPENIRRIAEGVLRIEDMATGKVKGVTEVTMRREADARKRKGAPSAVKQMKVCAQPPCSSGRTHGPRPLIARELGLRNDRRVTRCLKILHRFFPDPNDAKCWLDTPHALLGGVSALTLLRMNPNAVLTLLGNAENGIPS